MNQFLKRKPQNAVISFTVLFHNSNRIQIMCRVQRCQGGLIDLRVVKYWWKGETEEKIVVYCVGSCRYFSILTFLLNDMQSHSGEIL